MAKSFMHFLMTGTLSGALLFVATACDSKRFDVASERGVKTSDGGPDQDAGASAPAPADASATKDGPRDASETGGKTPDASGDRAQDAPRLADARSAALDTSSSDASATAVSLDFCAPGDTFNCPDGAPCAAPSCSDVSCRAAATELARALSDGYPTTRRYTGGATCSAPAVCRCTFEERAREGNALVATTQMNLVTADEGTPRESSCLVRGLLGACLFDVSEMTGCQASADCDAHCRTVDARIKQDEARRIAAAAVAGRCTNVYGSCKALVAAEDHCYEYDNVMTSNAPALTSQQIRLVRARRVTCPATCP